MSRSIFDPTGDETEHTGSRHTPPAADQISKMPADAVDGKLDEPDDEFHDVETPESPDNSPDAHG